MRDAHHHCDRKAAQNSDALTSIYEQYATRILTYFQYRCNDPAAAQDLTMQVFERLIGSLPGYDADRAPFSAWLFAIARHVAADWQRRRYLRRLLPWDDFHRLPSGEPGPEQHALESEERQRLRKALAQLSDRERDLIGLRFSSGLTNRAIAGLTRLGENNVAVIIYRALHKLRQHLAGTDEMTCPNSTPLTEVEHD